MVTSSRRSGTSVACWGGVSQAMPSTSSAQANSRLMGTATDSMSTRRSRSWIWRRSSRKWIVITSAPPSSASVAAHTGSGSFVLRASRTVATWSILTPRIANLLPPHKQLRDRGLLTSGAGRAKMLAGLELSIIVAIGLERPCLLPPIKRQAVPRLVRGRLAYERPIDLADGGRQRILRRSTVGWRV